MEHVQNITVDSRKIVQIYYLHLFISSPNLPESKNSFFPSEDYCIYGSSVKVALKTILTKLVLSA